MTYRHLLVSAEAPVAVVELDRKPQRNALCIALRDELEGCLRGLEADERIKAVVLWGGPDCFSAGFDLREVVESDLAAFGHRIVEFTQQTYLFAKPLVTAVAGPAYAGGFDLALSGDLIVAAESASFGRPEIRFGINPLISRLWLRIGMARALGLSLAGEPVTAQDALAIGLVDRVVPAAALLDTARALAGAIARQPLPALLAVKRAARTVPYLDPRVGVEYECGLSAELLRGGQVGPALREYARRLGIVRD